MGYDGLLLDHDGVLVTLGDPDALARAAAAALRDAGVDEPPPEAVEALRVSVDPSDLETISSRHDLPARPLWGYRDDRIADALRAETKGGRKTPYKDVGVLDAVTRPLGIVSNNQTRVVEFVLDHYGLADVFDMVRARAPTPESLEQKKPRPNFLEAAMSDLGVSDPLYVGDSESDVRAGNRCGLDVAYLRRDHNAGTTIDVTPRYEIQGLADAVALIDES